MYYSAGTYESFAHPEKPKDVDKKSAYIIGTGLAGLTAAFYLVRDGQMKGEHIHLLDLYLIMPSLNICSVHLFQSPQFKKIVQEYSFRTFWVFNR